MMFSASKKGNGMYHPPEGRPRSIPAFLIETPSSGSIPTRQRGDIDGAVAAYVAGESTKRIESDFGINHNALSKEVEKRGIPLRRGRYRKLPPVTDAAAQPATPSDSWRTSADFLSSLGKGVMASYRREERKTRALAARLNATEQAGVWMTPGMYADANDVTSGALSQRARANKWSVRPGAGGRIALYLVPHSAIRPKSEPSVVVTAAAAPEAKPSIWRRLFGWILPA